jgi:hypothetical protein
MISGCAVPAEQLGDHGYFGLSIDINRRFDQHESALKKNKHYNSYLQNCFNLYGGSNYFIWSVVEECAADQLSDREIHFISTGNTYENPKGFNFTPGGSDGIRDAASKPFAFIEKESGTVLAGTNLAQFCRDQKKYDYQQMCRLRRGDIQEYLGLIAVATPDLSSPETDLPPDNFEKS